MTYPKKLTARQVALRAGYRSGLEEIIGAQLDAHGKPWAYETVTLPYRVEETRKYTPDFVMLWNGILVESKGRYVTADRKKTRLILAQHPDLDLRLVFSNSRARISKQSKTTYAAFCEAQGIKYADKTIPTSWLNEPVNHKSLAVIREFTKQEKA